MKKNLIAIAALAATSAFAQSSVTLSGNLDVAAASITGTQAKMNGNTFTTRDAASSTSVIKIVAVEDLGGGNTATVQYAMDPRKWANDNSNYDLKTSMERDEVFVSLSNASVGTLKLGSPNSIGLTAQGASNPLGTGIGSGYAAASKDGTLSYSNIRYDRSARFDSASFSGLTISALYAPGGDMTEAATNLVPNARKVTEYGLTYANGPLTIAYVNVAQDAQVNNSTAATAAGTTIIGAATKVNALYANYVIGATTLYAGMNQGDAKAALTAASEAKGTRYGIKHTMGAVDLIAVQTKQKTTTSAGVATEVVITGARADYNLSKTAAVYLGYETYDNGATTANDRKIVAAGIRKSF